MCLDPARALQSCCREFDRKQFECRSVLSRLFLFIVQTAHGRPGAVCPPLQHQQQKGTLRTVRSSRKVRSQARPWILTEGRERRIFARAGLFAGWLLTRPAWPSHSGKNLVAFCPLEFLLAERVCRLVGLSLPLKDSTSSLFRCSSFLFFLSFEGRVGEVLEACLSARDSGSMLYARAWTRPDSNHERCIAVRRSLSDHVQSTSGSGQPKPSISLSLVSVVGTSRKRSGRARVKTDLSKLNLKNRRRSGSGNGFSVDHAKRFFFASVEHFGLGQVFEMRDCFARSISYFVRTRPFEKSEL